MLVIGICGASGSGKSTLAEELCRAIGSSCTVINHDCYYKDHSICLLRSAACSTMTSRRSLTTICS